MTSEDLISRARSGDAEAFRELTAPHHRELQAHCYRMLGSLQDAEDALQDTLLSAWRALAGFEGAASVRTWLYRIATNRCLNALRAGSRRPARAWDVPGLQPPEPTRLGEVGWLEPFPDAPLEDGLDRSAGPEVRFERTESISLAFVRGLQVLPPRQLAVLILRDVLGFQADEVASMLGTTVAAVHSALKRARTGLEQQEQAGPRREPPPAVGSAIEAATVARFVSAYESADVATLVDLLTDDAFMAMPPIANEYQGRDAVERFLRMLFGAGRRYELVPTRANGQPALGSYMLLPDGRRQGSGLLVLALAGDRICELIRFERGLLRWFGLPPSLPGRPAPG